MRERNIIDQNYLRSLLEYDPDTGHFFWRSSGKGRKLGQPAGALNRTKGQGYVSIGIDKSKFRAHRLAFIYMTGDCPDEIDHINGDRADNRWDNLRAVTRSQNNMNATRRGDNSSGQRGVSWVGRVNRWRAFITIEGKQKHLGYFIHFDEACAAYRAAAIEVFGDYVRGEHVDAVLD